MTYLAMCLGGRYMGRPLLRISSNYQWINVRGLAIARVYVPRTSSRAQALLAICPTIHRELPGLCGARTASTSARRAQEDLRARNRNVAIYMASIVAAVLGISYAAVPLYKVFCQVTGFGGTTQVADAEKAKKMTPVEGGRLIRVTFDATVADTMPWKFRATQSDVKVIPGETALAFFTAVNPTRKNITGVATYNVFPPKAALSGDIAIGAMPLGAGIYFNKIQCFCFEEQRLKAGEEIDMPVFFFLDPEILDDPAMDSVNNVTLSYTFFQTGEDMPSSPQTGQRANEGHSLHATGN